MDQIILASASPRRRELLQQIGVGFQVIPAQGEEVITSTDPEEVVQELALQKAREIAEGQSVQDHRILVIGADTVVACEGRILGKPGNQQEAEEMLSLLSGRSHGVYTGVALILVEGEKRQEHSFYEQTKVTMYPLSQQEIQDYIATGEPMDKAGAYGIQGKGAVYIQEISGDYNNVVGLPVARIYQETKALGIEICEHSYYHK